MLTLLNKGIIESNKVIILRINKIKLKIMRYKIIYIVSPDQWCICNIYKGYPFYRNQTLSNINQAWDLLYGYIPYANPNIISILLAVLSSYLQILQGHHWYILQWRRISIWVIFICSLVDLLIYSISSYHVA